MEGSQPQTRIEHPLHSTWDTTTSVPGHLYCWLEIVVYWFHVFCPKPPFSWELLSLPPSSSTMSSQWELPCSCMAFLATVDVSRGVPVWAWLNYNWEMTTRRNCDMRGLVSLVVCSPPCRGHCSAGFRESAIGREKHNWELERAGVLRAFECLDLVVSKVQPYAFPSWI